MKEHVNSGLSIQQIADREGYSKTNVLYWLTKYSLKTKWGTLDGCPCGEKNPNNLIWRKNGIKRRNICKTCHKKSCKERLRDYKALAVAYKGGKCQTCGYDKCIGAMDFHHRDPTKKDSEWNKIRSRSIKKMKDELDKCDLLCSNCHREHHWSEK